MRISAQVQQPSLLNIDLHSTVREQQVQTSNHNIYGQVQSHPEYTLKTCKHLNCYTTPPPQHKRALNKEQIEVKPLTNLSVNPTTGPHDKLSKQLIRMLTKHYPSNGPAFTLQRPKLPTGQ